MSSSTLRNLAIVVAVLVAVLVVMQLANGPAEDTTGELLLPDLKARINDIDSLVIERSDQSTVSIAARDDRWVVASRGDFPADVAKIRQVLLALADARVLEQKTANADRYVALGVQDPEVEGSAGVRLTAAGGGEEFAVVLGNVATGSNRYVRPAGEPGSLLIDRDPGVPDDVAGWLANELVDIDTDDVASVSIEHADGERIVIEKVSADDADFTVVGIPDGRELSYPTVANSIAGALNGLELEDVRSAVGEEAATETQLATFDGLQVTAAVYPETEETIWISLQATAEDPGDQRVESLNALAAGREFRIPAFRGNQLTRRWEDILKKDPATE